MAGWQDRTVRHVPCATLHTQSRTIQDLKLPQWRCHKNGQIPIFKKYVCQNWQTRKQRLDSCLQSQDSDLFRLRPPAGAGGLCVLIILYIFPNFRFVIICHVSRCFKLSKNTSKKHVKKKALKKHVKQKKRQILGGRGRGGEDSRHTTCFVCYILFCSFVI